jgi:hypothetical protein
MFGFFTKKRIERFEEEVRKSFLSVKNDFEGVGKWIKHLHESHGDVNDMISALKGELSTIKFELEELKESVGLRDFEQENQQMFKKQTAVDKQTGVYGVQELVQTPVQTVNFYEILQGLSVSERLLIFTLMNAAEDMKLSYEDLARLLGKERATIRGQINSIKQKSEGLLEEVREPNGKKRVYIAPEIKEKLAKYAKVRVNKEKKYKKLPKEI